MVLLQRISEELHYILLTKLHFLAMHIPNSHAKRILYRLRGSKIGARVDFSYGVFLEEHFPECITIHDNVDLGPCVIIVAHDSSYKCVSSENNLVTKKVIIEQNVYIGAGSVILPGVRIGHHSLIGADQSFRGIFLPTVWRLATPHVSSALPMNGSAKKECKSKVRTQFYLVIDRKDA